MSVFTLTPSVRGVKLSKGGREKCARRRLFITTLSTAGQQMVDSACSIGFLDLHIIM